MRIGGIFGGNSPIAGIGSLFGSLGGMVGGQTGDTLNKVGQGAGIFSSFLSLFGKSAVGGPLGFLSGLVGIGQQLMGLFGGKKS